MRNWKSWAGAMLAFLLLGGAVRGETQPIIPNQHLNGSLGVDGTTSLTTLQVSGVTTLTALVVDGATTLTTLTAAGLRYPMGDGSAGQAMVTDGAGGLGFADVGSGNEHPAVTMSGRSYLGLSSQTITVGAVDLATSHVTGVLPAGNISAEIALRDDVDTSIGIHTAITGAHHALATVAGHDYLTIGASPSQVVTAGHVELDAAHGHVAGVLPDANVSDTLTIGSGSTVNADSINAGTVSTSRFSAYNDLVAESKVGAGSTQVSAGNHQHSGVYEPVLNWPDPLDAGKVLTGYKTFVVPSFSMLSGTATDAQIPNILTIDSGSVVDGGAIKAGTVGTDYYSAFTDLWAESKVGMSDEQVARGNHVHDAYPTDYVDKLATSQTMQGTLILPSVNVGGATDAEDAEIKIKHALNAPRVTTVFLTPADASQGPSLFAYASAVGKWYDEDNILSDTDANAAASTTGSWPLGLLYVYDAGFSGLSGVTFTGIEVTFRSRQDFGEELGALFVSCVHGSQVLGYTKEHALETSFSYTTHTLGGASDLWGMTQEEAQAYIPINASFGLGLEGSLYESGDHIWVDWIKIKVYYTASSVSQAWGAGTNLSGDYMVARGEDFATTPAFVIDGGTLLPQFPAMGSAGFLKNDASGNVTGGNNAGLADDSMVDTLHRHSELSASDGTPNPAVSVDASGNVNVVTASTKFGVGGSQTATYTLTAISPSGLQEFGLYHDNSNAYVKTSTGSMIFQNMAADSPLTVTFRGTGSTAASYSQIRFDDRDTNMAYAIFGCYGGYVNLYGGGTGLAPIRIQDNADTGVTMFGSAASGETPAFTISGYRAADAKRTLSVAVGSAAADQVDFSGLTTYKFTGSINATANLQTGGTTRLDASGNATLGTVTAVGAAEGATPLNVSTVSATFGANKNLSLLYYQDALVTADATPTTLLTIPIVADTICTVEAVVTAGNNADNTKGAGYKLTGTYHNDAGTATLIGSVSAGYTAESDAAWDATLTASGANVLVTVTGKASTGINWSGTATRHIAYPVIP